MRIPRTIHYCWFGGNALPPLAARCIQSWERNCPGWRVILWNEHSVGIFENDFARSAYESGKFAFVSDYVRAFALANYGGVYLDTDVELHGSLDPFLHNRAFTGFETKGYPFTAVWGAEPNHPWPTAVLAQYNRTYSEGERPNTRAVSRLLSDRYGIDPSTDCLQTGEHGIVVYPSTFFCLDLPRNVATHHFAGSWLDDHPDVSYKDDVMLRWHRDQYFEGSRSFSDGHAVARLVQPLGAQRAVMALLAGLLRTVTQLGINWIRSKQR